MDKSSKYTNPTQVQSGIIDVFKNYHVYENNSKHYKRKGEIIHKMAGDIGRKVISIEGNLSASNYIELPNPELKKSMDYTGKYYYIQIKANEEKKFSFQLIFSLNSMLVKFNFKYPLAEIKFTQTNAFNIDIPLDPDAQENFNPFNEDNVFNLGGNNEMKDYEQQEINENYNNNQINEKKELPKKISAFSFWNIYRFCPAEFISEFFSEEFKTFGSITSENLIFKSFIAQSNFQIRGLFISNSLYENGLPPQLCFKKMTDKTERILLHCNFYDVNYIFKPKVYEDDNEMQPDDFLNSKENIDSSNPKFKVSNISINKQNFSQYSGMDINESKRAQEKQFQEKQQKLESTLLKNHDEELDSLEKRANQLKKEAKDKTQTTSSHKNSIAEKVKEFQNNSMSRSLSRGPPATKQDHDLKEVNSELLRKQMERANQEALDKRIAVKNVFKRQEEKRVSLLPDPIMNLKYILGFTGNICPVIKYYNINDKKDILFPSGNMMINFDYQNLKQRFFLGHSKPISSSTITNDFTILFTAQEGKNSIIRVWKIDTTRCIKILTTPYEKICSMSVSKNNKILTTVGLEGCNKELIILWDISNIENIQALIRQGSHFNITQIKFSPYDQSILASCGKENIKFWRIKNDHLGGKAVVLNQYARNSYFNCLDYDNPFMGDNLSKGRLYVGNNLGCIFQVSCNSMELDAVYKIHDTPITSLSVNDAFCATGSEDGYLRIWPIDFSEFLIEAKHDSPVISIDISFDALDIVCGTLNGSIGTLNIQSKQYSTLLRSPPGKVYDMAVHPEGNYLFTIEENCSVRVWDIETKSESFQFFSAKDPPTFVAAPKRINIFACGFTSGSLKVFDIENTSVLYECRAFNQAISKIAFIQNSTILISMSTSGHLSLHDASNEFIQMKVIKIDAPTVYSDLSVPSEDTIFASIGPESNCLLVWNTTSYGLRNRIPVEGNLAKKLSFINTKLLGTILENGNIMIFSLMNFEGLVVKEFNYLHSSATSTLNISKNYKYLITGGEEGMIKVLDSKMMYKSYSSYQQYIGHTKGIKSLIILEHKSLVITVSENDGIFFWNFLGDLTFSETELINDMDNLAVYGPAFFKKNKYISNNSTQMGLNQKKYLHLEKTYNQTNISEQNNMIFLGKEDESSIKDENNLSNNKGMNNKPPLNEVRRQIKNNISTKCEREVDKLVMMPIDIEEGGENNIFNYTKGSFKPDLSQQLLQSGDSFIKMTNVMGTNKEDYEGKIFFEPSFVPEKTQLDVEVKENSNKLEKKFILGMALGTRNNLLYNPYKRYFVFTINNKIIVEFLEELRYQLVLEDSKDEISSIAFSPEYKLISATVGHVNNELNAPIFIYETENFTLLKRLNFHFKGIQLLRFSNCGNYMISIGNREEKSICVWNTYNYTVLDSKSLKFSIFDIKCEKMLMINSISNKSLANVSALKKGPFLYFISCGQEVLSFWRMDAQGKLEGYHIKLEDIIRDKNEFITGIELTPYFEKIRTSFVLVGTSSGCLLVLEKEKKMLIKKYIISQTPILNIVFSLERLLVISDSPVIYSWIIPFNKIDEDNVFDFLKDTKDNGSILFLDKNIRATDFSIDGREGLVATENGGVFYVNIKDQTNIKIINSHLNSEINSITTKEKEQLVTCSDDGTIRAWTLDSFDQKYEFCYYGTGEKCEFIESNPKEGVALVLFKFYSNNFINNESNNNIIPTSIGNDMSFNNNQLLNKTVLNTSLNQFNPQGIQTFIRVYNMNKLKTLGKISIPENGIFINNFKLIFNGNGLITTTYQDKIYVLDVQNWEPLSVLYTETNSNFMPKNQQFKHIDSMEVNSHNTICSMAFSNGTIVLLNIVKNQSKIDTEIIDKYNLFEYHISKSEDLTTAELFKNLTKYRSNYISSSIFSKSWDGVLFSFHECLQFLFLRNYHNKEIFRRIPLNFFPLSISLSTGENYISIGTKEGIVLFITRIDNNVNTGFNLDVFKGHYSGIKALTFTEDKTQLITASHSELIVWGIN